MIREFSYDPADHRLDVTFVSGKRYHYHDVPARIAAGMRQAISKGRYFNARVRDRFRFTQED